MKPLLWLYREGSWYILDTDQCGEDMKPYPHQSLIWHQCPLGTDNYKGMWRVSNKNMGLPCGVCQEVCPEGLQALWRFHNWETLDRLHMGSWDGCFYGFTGTYVKKVDV